MLVPRGLVGLVHLSSIGAGSAGLWKAGRKELPTNQ